MTLIQKISIAVTVVLVAVGIYGYIATDMASWTALIPAILGGLIAVCPWWSSNPRVRKHGMHAAMLLALVGIGGTFGGLTDLGSALEGTSEKAPIIIIMMSITCLVMMAYMALGIFSFIQARRSPQPAVS